MMLSCYNNNNRKKKKTNIEAVALPARLSLTQDVGTLLGASASLASRSTLGLGLGCGQMGSTLEGPLPNIFCQIGEKVRPGTFGKIKVGSREYPKSPSVKKHEICSDPVSAAPTCPCPRVAPVRGLAPPVQPAVLVTNKCSNDKYDYR